MDSAIIFFLSSEKATPRERERETSCEFMTCLLLIVFRRLNFMIFGSALRRRHQQLFFFFYLCVFLSFILQLLQLKKQWKKIRASFPDRKSTVCFCLNPEEKNPVQSHADYRRVIIRHFTRQSAHEKYLLKMFQWIFPSFTSLPRSPGVCEMLRICTHLFIVLVYLRPGQLMCGNECLEWS